MDFSDYQTKYPPIGHPVIYPTLGLANEAGEVAGKVKKIFRDKQGLIGPAEREALKSELGDVLWYLAQVCTELELSLDEVAEANIEKLYSRLERGKIGGDGDNR
jgi:NTP pyrophosphatase (non-canonical NTP hydrolase)